MKPVTLSILGAGSRGLDAYANYAIERAELCKVVAVAEPRDAYREEAVRRFHIPPEGVFRDWREFAARPRMSDAVLIATKDSMHTEPALACMELGYDLLLEKPMAPTADECRAIAAMARRKRCILAVGHVLRYAPRFRKLRELIQAGVIGEIANVRHVEGVAYWHYAHSFVRGNWRNTRESAPMILSKCCHDTDILLHLIDRKCRRVGSFGGRSHFCRANQPVGAADRCLDCRLADTCLYSATAYYFRQLRGENHSWPTNVVISEFTEAALTQALREGPYGRCVYACDNDVVEHQSVVLEFDGRISATLTMTAFTTEASRTTDIYGTLGEIHADSKSIVVHRFGEAKPEIHEVSKLTDTIAGGHGGGDSGLAADFIAAVSTRDQARLTSGPDISLESHLIAFAAEESWQTGQMVDVRDR